MPFFSFHSGSHSLSRIAGEGSDRPFSSGGVLGVLSAIGVVFWSLLALPPCSATGEKVIYGADDRREAYEITDPEHRAISEVTCLAVTLNDIENNNDGTYRLKADPWVAIFGGNGGTPLCPEEPFYGQPQAGFCSAFLVGQDLLATAGHCVGSVAPAFSCGQTAFIFGFEQIDSENPAETLIPADQVYFCSEIIENRWPEVDCCILRVDRPVTHVIPYPIRREDAISTGDPVAVIGHPRGLPKKIASGAYVQDPGIGNTIFNANLDTLHGNSGSPVFNPVTNLIEGIFVSDPHGEFISVGGCLRSVVVADDSSGSQAVKSTAFADLVPEVYSQVGHLLVERNVAGCNSTLVVQVRDGGLAGAGVATVVANASRGDIETLVLMESDISPGSFEGLLHTTPGNIAEEDGFLQVEHGETIHLFYTDETHLGEGPGLVEQAIEVDCVPPALSAPTLEVIGARYAQVSLTSDEPITARARYGPGCFFLSEETAVVELSQTPLLTLSGLSPNTDYWFVVEASDEAGNSVLLDNLGACFHLTTGVEITYLVESFSEGEFDLEDSSITFTPDGSPSFYEACISPATQYPTDPRGGNVLVLNDDDCAEVYIGGDSPLLLFGQPSLLLHVATNGAVSFDGRDPYYSGNLMEHLAAPRVSVLAADLVSGQNISWKRTEDRVAVTYDAVLEFGATAPNRFQVELFFDGRIRFTYLEIEVESALVGLSDGQGLNPDFRTTDLSESPSCEGNPTFDPRADFNQDGRVDAIDLGLLLEMLKEAGQ